MCKKKRMNLSEVKTCILPMEQLRRSMHVKYSLLIKRFALVAYGVYAQYEVPE